MGVNDLAGMADDDRHADMIHEVAREAWHPVSDPPTGADANSSGDVLVWLSGDVIRQVYWGSVPRNAYGFKWARICDVVLLPEGAAE